MKKLKRNLPLHTSSSTQEKVADSVRENTPSASGTMTSDLPTSTVDTNNLSTGHVDITHVETSDDDIDTGSNLAPSNKGFTDINNNDLK